MINSIYQQILETIRTCTSNQMSVLVGDIYDLNKIDGEHPFYYPILILTRGKSVVDLSNEKVTYTFTLYYVDRKDDYLAHDKDQESSSDLPKVHNYTEYNLQVTSDESAEQVLVTILRCLDENSLADLNVSLRQIELVPFKEKFNDVCRGAYVTFSVSKRITNCTFSDPEKMV